MKEGTKYLLNSEMRDRKVIIYGIGCIFERYRPYLYWDKVAAIVDMSADKQGRYIENIRIESPEKIACLQYDYIVIFSDIYFENAKMNLIGNYFVEEQKIVSWRIFFHIEFINEAAVHNVVLERRGIYKEYIEVGTDYEAIDIGNQQMKKLFLTNEPCFSAIDNLGRTRFSLHKSFYRNCFEKYSEIEKKYDTVLLWGDFEEVIRWDDLMELAQGTIIWTVPYSCIIRDTYQNNLDRFEKWGKKRMFLFADAIVYVFEKRSVEKKLNCEIFVVTHKEYNVLQGGIYKPLCVGGQYENKLFYMERTGDNIAYLNDRINECTALYWIWKNTDCEYVGLNHYRRYFYNNEIRNCANYLTENVLNEIFEEDFDIILPELTKLAIPVLDNIIKAVGQNLANAALDIVRSLLEERASEYVEAFEYVILHNVFYKCHMFVTKRQQFDCYCEWLFSFLIDAANLLDVSQCDAHHKRTMGYFAETLLTVWLLEQNFKVKELPITEI